MKNFALIFLALLLSPFCHAFYVVGGEFELTHLEEFRYRLKLMTYFDEVQNLNPGPDDFVTIVFYANKDHEEMDQYTLALTDLVPLMRTDEECQLEILEISQVSYVLDIELDPDRYDDP